MNDAKVLLELLRSDGSIVINKRLARSIGIDAAIMYSELISKYLYFDDRSQLTEDGFFFNTVEDMEYDTTLSDHQQRKAIKKLVQLGLLQHKNKGIPQRRYFKVTTDTQRIINMLQDTQTQSRRQNLKNSRIETQKSEELKLKKVKGNNTKVNNTKENNTKDNLFPKEQGTVPAYFLENIPNTIDHEESINQLLDTFYVAFEKHVGEKHNPVDPKKLIEACIDVDKYIEYNEDGLTLSSYSLVVDRFFNIEPKFRWNVVYFAKAAPRLFREAEVFTY